MSCDLLWKIPLPPLPIHLHPLYIALLCSQNLSLPDIVLHISFVDYLYPQLEHELHKGKDLSVFTAVLSAGEQ